MSLALSISLKLVGGFEHGFYFPKNHGIILPIDELHHFSRLFFNHQLGGVYRKHGEQITWFLYVFWDFMRKHGGLMSSTGV